MLTIEIKNKNSEWTVVNQHNRRKNIDFFYNQFGKKVFKRNEFRIDSMTIYDLDENNEFT